MSYVPGQPDALDPRLKANEARTIPITAITLPHLTAARRRRDELEQRDTWHPQPEFADVVLLRDDGSAERLNHDNALFHEWMNAYEVSYRDLSPGSLRHASATYYANYAGTDGRGVSPEKLRQFLGHTPRSNLDAYYARASTIALADAFSESTYDRRGERERLTGETANSPSTSEA